MQINIVKILTAIIILTTIIPYIKSEKAYGYNSTSSAVMQGSALDFDTHFALVVGTAMVKSDDELVKGGNIITRTNETHLKKTVYKNIQLGIDMKVLDPLNATFYVSNTTTDEYQGASQVFAMGLGTALTLMPNSNISYKIDYEAHYNSFNFRKIKENKTLKSKPQMLTYKGDGYLIGASLLIYKHVSIMAFYNRNNYKLKTGKTNIPRYDALIDQVIPKRITTTLNGIAIGVDF